MAPCFFRFTRCELKLDARGKCQSLIERLIGSKSRQCNLESRDAVAAAVGGPGYRSTRIRRVPDISWGPDSGVIDFVSRTFLFLSFCFKDAVVHRRYYIALGYAPAPRARLDRFIESRNWPSNSEFFTRLLVSVSKASSTIASL